MTEWLQLGADGPRPRSTRWVPDNTVPAAHLPSPTHLMLSLCQEYAMRTHGYDDRASVSFLPGHGILPRAGIDGDYQMVGGPDGKQLGPISTSFAHGVTSVGLEAAIAAVYVCAWCSSSDFTDTVPVPCAACLEVAHA